MRATSEQQAAALREGRIPATEEVRPGLFAIALAMPGTPGMPPYAFVYAALAADGSGTVDLVDAGLNTEQNWEALGRELRGLGTGIERVASVTITHLHGDHTGLAARIRAVSGATVRMHAREAAAVRGGARYGGMTGDGAGNGTGTGSALVERWGVPDAVRPELIGIADRVIVGEHSESAGGLTIDEELGHGDVFQLGAYRATAIHTPGHTAGHLCIALPAERLVFTGDHVLPVVNPGIALGGDRAADPLGEYYASLARIAEYGDAEALPGHGFRFAGVAERAAEIRAHHEQRTRQVAAALAAAPELSTWELAARVSWTGGWGALAGVSLLSALAQTEMHAARVAADLAEGG